MSDPHYESDDVVIHLGDCIEVMSELPAGSIDAIVCDPPYGIEFMGNEWDSFRQTERAGRWSGERSGSAGARISPEDEPGLGGVRVAYGGKRPTTSRCTGCGKRDAFRNPHDCTEGAEWVRELVEEGTAPPSMLAFQVWTEAWAREAYRVLKPGGHLIAFSGTRTYHRTAAGVEDAGFEVRDQVHWLYGSGFPKSKNIAREIDRQAGAEPEVRREALPGGSSQGGYETNLFGDADQVAMGKSGISASLEAGETWQRTEAVVDAEAGEVRTVAGGQQVFTKTDPVTDEAKQWAGWGTALKPGHEPMVFARKPIAEANIARNVLKYGTGAINVDGERIAGPEENPSISRRSGNVDLSSSMFREGSTPDYDLYRSPRAGEELGRWPANLVLQHSAGCRPLGVRRIVSDSPPVPMPAQNSETGGRTYGFKHGEGRTGEMSKGHADENGMEVVEVYQCEEGCPVLKVDQDAGVREAQAHRGSIGGYGPSRFFLTLPPFDLAELRYVYCPKPGPGEKDVGLDDLPPEKQEDATHPPDGPGADNPRNRSGEARQNNHPTVKPIALMEYLLGLVVPPDGVVLDPFMGSGTTGCAAVRKGLHFVGVEREERFAEMARLRIEHWRPTQASLFG